MFDSDTTWMVLGLDSQDVLWEGGKPSECQGEGWNVSVVLESVLYLWSAVEKATNLVLAPVFQARWVHSVERLQLSGEQGADSAGEGCGDQGGCSSKGKKGANWETRARSRKPACGGDQTHNQPQG